MLYTKSMPGWSQIWSKSFSTFLLFIPNIWVQSYFYCYILRLANQKWDTSTLPFLAFPKIHVYHCWLLHSFSPCLSDSSPMTITQKVSHHTSMSVPGNHSFTNLQIKMEQGVMCWKSCATPGFEHHVMWYWYQSKTQVFSVRSWCHYQRSIFWKEKRKQVNISWHDVQMSKLKEWDIVWKKRGS